MNLLSFNCNGFNLHKQLFIKDIAISSDILLLQEHFLLNSNSKTIKKLLPDFDMNFKAAVKCNLNVQQGRHSGGLALLWKKKN